MSNEPVPLKEYFEKQIEWVNKLSDEREKRYQERFIAQQEAIKVADERMREYKESANELRSTFINKTEHHLLQEQVNRIELRSGEDHGVTEGISKTWGWVIAILGLAVAVSSFFLGHFIK